MRSRLHCGPCGRRGPARGKRLARQLLGSEQLDFGRLCGARGDIADELARLLHHEGAPQRGDIAPEFEEDERVTMLAIDVDVMADAAGQMALEAAMLDAERHQLAARFRRDIDCIFNEDHGRRLARPRRAVQRKSPNDATSDR